VPPPTEEVNGDFLQHREYSTMSTTEQAKLGMLALRMRAILDGIDRLNAELKGLKENKDHLSRLIQQEMEDTGIDSVKNNEAGLTLSVRDELVPSYDPEHFSEIFQWCALTGRHDFIQRRMSGAKIREYVDSGGELPEGLTLTPMTKVTFRRS
tara:strand:+ start:90 stop:548 length:459 start_codon:yes stop_codon:yes gene_type:complete